MLCHTERWEMTNSEALLKSSLTEADKSIQAWLARNIKHLDQA